MKARVMIPWGWRRVRTGRAKRHGDREIINISGRGFEWEPVMFSGAGYLVRRFEVVIRKVKT